MVFNQTLAARQLLLAVVIEALNSIETMEDVDWVLGDVAGSYMRLIGLSDEAIWNLRLHLVLGAVDFSRLDNSRRVHALRWDVKAKESTAADSRWASWGSLGVDGVVLGR